MKYLSWFEADALKAASVYPVRSDVWGAATCLQLAKYRFLKLIEQKSYDGGSITVATYAITKAGQRWLDADAAGQTEDGR